MDNIDVDRVVQMGQEYEETKRATIKQLLDRQKETAVQLRLLGYGGKLRKNPRGTKPCSKCSSTEHDARFHRGAGKSDSSGDAVK